MIWLRFFIFFCVFSFSQTLLANAQVDVFVEQGKYDQAVALSLKEKSHYLSFIVNKARSLDLANNATWLALGHYKKNLFGQYESQVDGRDFFFSQTGKTTPNNELEATLAAFFSNHKLESSKFSAQCRFIARFFWLNQQLQFDESQLNIESCKDYQLYLDILVPDQLTVVFPATHPNSPSSMFGHTLLRVDKKGQTEQTKMLNYSINYAAQIRPGTSSLSYTALGLSGGFPGKFSIVPYYTKLREYAQMENRDVWEYTLNMTSKKIDFILMHTYELSPSYFDYYFFTENCSYHLLSLLDVSFADDPFTDYFSGWTIPVDTLRLLRKKNLVADVKYYPSHARIIKAKQKAMLSVDLLLTNQVLTDGLDNHKATIQKLTPSRQTQVLDLLNDYYRFQKLKLSPHSAGKLNQLERKVLLMRSKIKQRSILPKIQPPSIHPDFGHGSSKISVGASRLKGDNDLTLHWRPAYHDLLDPSAGFMTNASLEFMDIGFAYHVSQEKLRINNVTILDIMSLEPRDDFFSNISWRISMGWQKQAELDLRNISYIEGGGGLSYSLSERYQLSVYALLGSTLQYGNGLSKNTRIAPELRLGAVSEILSGWRMHAYFESLKGVWGDTSQLNTFVFQQSLAISKNLAFRVGGEAGYKEGARWNKYNAELHYYF